MSATVPICSTCWNVAKDPVEIPDPDGVYAPLTVCRIHAESAEDLIARVEAMLS